MHFVDATDVEDAETIIGTWFSDIAEGNALDVKHTVVDVRDLLAADADLTVQRWVDTPDRDPAEVATAYQEGWNELHKVVKTIEASRGSSSISQAPRTRASSPSATSSTKAS